VKILALLFKEKGKMNISMMIEKILKIIKICVPKVQVKENYSF